jgi:hypothetical protein
VLEDFAGFLHSFYREPEDYQDHSGRFLGWLDVVRACGDLKLRADYQRYYLQRHVPARFRGRLAQESREAGRLLEAAGDGAPAAEPRPAAPPPAEPPPPPPADNTFLLTGVSLSSNSAGWLAGPWRGAWWLLGPLAGGVLAAWLFGLFGVPARQLPLLGLFLPLIVSLADGAALRGVAAGARAAGTERPRGRDLLGRLGAVLLAGGLLGLLGGLLAGGAALLLAAPPAVCLCVGCAAAGAVAAGSLLGLVASLLAGRSRLPAGPLAGALVSAASVAIYLGLARWLLP